MSDTTITGADGTRIAVRRTGAGEPVVALHGSGGGLSSWAAVAERLADRHELWLVARRGHAPSDRPAAANTFAAEVGDVRAVLAAAGAAAGRPAHLVGGSTGAILALHTALEDPEAVRSLALFEPPLFAAGPTLAPVLGRYRALLDRGALSDAAALYATEVARVPPAVLELFAAARAQQRPDPAEERRAAIGTLYDFEALVADRPDTARWAAIALPTLLLQGTETWAPVPASMDALAGALPHATRVALEGQAHFATATAPALVAEALGRFYAAV